MVEEVVDENLEVFSVDDQEWLNIADSVESTGNISLESLSEKPDDGVVSESVAENVAAADSEVGTGENFLGDSEKSGTDDNSAWIDSVLNGLSDRKPDDDAVASEAVSTDDVSVVSGAGIDSEAIMKKTKELLLQDENTKDLLELYGDDLDDHLKIALKMQEALKGNIVNNDLSERVANIEKLTARVKEEEDRKRAIEWNAEVEREVPEWRDIIQKDKRFPGWFEQQSSIYKKCLQEASAPSDVVEALKKFKRDMGVADTRMNNHMNLYGNPVNDTNVVRNNYGRVQLSEEELWNRISDEVESGKM